LKLQAIGKEAKALGTLVCSADSLSRDISDMLDLHDLGEDVSAQLPRLAADVQAMESRIQGPDDHKAVYLVIKAGSGGREACNWAEMLLRMYSKRVCKLGLSAEFVDMTDNDPDGIKSATLKITGDCPFGQFKREAGIHRLSRVSPFDQADRRQTSFASVEVIPDIQKSVLTVDEDDLECWTCCGGGPGGQNVNRRHTVACVKHIPTGIMVRCQNERSQEANKVIAMELLMAKLERKFNEEREAAEASLKKALPQPKFGGTQARSYILSQHPMVKDHRTDKEVLDIDAVLDGDLDDLY